MMQKIILNSVLFILCVTTANAQAAFSCSGGDATGTGGSLSFTSGLVAYTAYSETTGSVIQGVQQPYEISVVSGVEKLNDILPTLSVYPNPTTEVLFLKTMNFKVGNLRYHLCTINGSSIENKKIVNDITTINMSNYTPATYFIKVYAGKSEIKTFKIIKK